MNNFTEVSNNSQNSSSDKFQHEVKNLKKLLANPNSSSRAINKEWERIVQEFPNYDSSMFKSLLELFRLCGTQSSSKASNACRPKLAREFWDNMEKKYLSASEEEVSAQQRIDDFSLALSIQNLSIAEKMLDNKILKTAIFNLEKDSEEKPLKTVLFKRALFASQRGKIIIKLVSAIKDEHFIRKFIDNLKTQAQANNVSPSANVEFLEGLLWMTQSPTNFPKNDSALAVLKKVEEAKGKKRKSEVSDESSDEVCEVFTVSSADRAQESINNAPYANTISMENSSSNILTMLGDGKRKRGISQNDPIEIEDLEDVKTSKISNAYDDAMRLVDRVAEQTNSNNKQNMYGLIDSVIDDCLEQGYSFTSNSN